MPPLDVEWLSWVPINKWHHILIGNFPDFFSEFSAFLDCIREMDSSPHTWIGTIFFVGCPCWERNQEILFWGNSRLNSWWTSRNCAFKCHPISFERSASNFSCGCTECSWGWRVLWVVGDIDITFPIIGRHIINGSFSWSSPTPYGLIPPKIFDGTEWSHSIVLILLLPDNNRRIKGC